MAERCPACHQKLRRSNDQNRRLWAIYAAISDKLKPKGETYSMDTWHLYCKARWLGADDVRLPNGKVIVMPKSTADLDRDAFGDYMTQVEAWANEHGVWLEDMEATA